MHYAVPRKITEQQERNCVLSYCGLPVTTKPVPCILYLFFFFFPLSLQPRNWNRPWSLVTLNIQRSSLSAPSRKPQGTLLVKTAPSKHPSPYPPASFCLVETFPRWASAAAMPRITMRAGNMAALLCEELFSSAWKEHHLALLEGSFRVWDAFKCMKICPRI